MAIIGSKAVYLNNLKHKVKGVLLFMAGLKVDLVTLALLACRTVARRHIELEFCIECNC